MNSVITVTDEAAKHLEELKHARVKKSGRCLRLVATPGGAGVLLDSPRSEDNVVRLNGSPLFYLHPILACLLDGAVLDYVDGDEGPFLTLTK